MGLGGFTIEKTFVHPPTYPANRPLFVKGSASLTQIQGDGGTPNTITVTVPSIPEDVGVGNEILIESVTPTDYNETGVFITKINSLTEFEYETTSHTNSTLANSGLIVFLDPFKLSDDTPPQLAQFVHMDLLVGLASIVQLTKDGGVNWYSVANNEQQLGAVFRSEPIKLGDLFNVRFVTAQTIQISGELLLEE